MNQTISEYTATTMDFIVDLADADATMLPKVGGKAANLGELIRAGLPVPPGFCVTTEAYAKVAASTTVAYDGLDAAAAAKVRESFVSAAIPKSIAEKIVQAYNRLGDDVPVAVRSSATAEDLPHASFAGQQDTYLNVVGSAAVLDAVQRCWASLWTERAVVYRTTNGIDHRAVKLAVVVQRMIDSQIAGVLFTANPVTGKRRQAVIDASPGLGEAVVSGAVNPDHFVVDTATGKILERQLGDKKFEVRSMEGGGTRHVKLEAGNERACVTDEQVQLLTALGDRVEAYFGRPQDTEWAIDSCGAIWLTQARPITTLFPLPPRATADPLHVYFCFSVAQGLNRPLTPAGLSAIRLIASYAARLFGLPVEKPLAGPAAYKQLGQRVFIDLTDVLRGSVGRTLLPRMLDVMEARSAAILRKLIEDPRLPLEHRSWLPLLRPALRIAIPNGIPGAVMKALTKPEEALKRVKKVETDLVQRVRPRESATSLERLNWMEQFLGGELLAVGPKTMPPAAAGLAMLVLVSKLLGKDVTEAELQTVLRGLPNNITTEMDLALWRVACSIRKDEAATKVFLAEAPSALTSRFRSGTLPAVAQKGLASFLEDYGHRAIAEIDMGMPRWSDDPTHILGVLSNYLRLDNDELAPDKIFARGANEAEAMIETLAGRARKRSSLHGWFVRKALQRARQLAGLREMPKYCMIVGLAAMRRELAMVGEDLVRQGKIASVDDIYFLDLADVHEALRGSDMRDRVIENRQSYELELRRRHVPRVLCSDGTEPETLLVSRGEGAGLAGTAASAGSVTGIARVVLDPVGAHIEPGEILVAPSTDPGWTPLFLTAGGLVMEMGGANSHGAVVAREYGIPAVVGVPDATLRIVTGQRITVDGAAGTIQIHK